MKKAAAAPLVINSVSELHRLLGLPKPGHPLVSVIDLSQITCFPDTASSHVNNFYSVCIKKGFKGKLKYGQNYYDFDEGVMSFFSPGQVLSTEVGDEVAHSGIWLVIHPDFIRGHPLGKLISEYGFFSYAVTEALHLSEKEEGLITGIMQQIAEEYRTAIDTDSQGVIIAQIALLLVYCNRFYNRQFITRKAAGNELLIKLEALLDAHFNVDGPSEKGLPTVQDIAAQLHVSPNCLSDMLRSLTGQNTQQHIHGRLIEKAKGLLSTTSLSVSEIAYGLGFGYPQSFNKRFKKETSVSPLQFRASFN